MPFRKPIKITKLDQETDRYSTYYNTHAEVNKSGSGKEYLKAGAERSQTTKVFEVRYCDLIKAIEGNTQLYNIEFEGRTYNIQDYDDPFEKHKTVRLLGVLIHA